jgi:hypothetical protein
MLPPTYESSCAAIPSPAAAITQDQRCFGPTAGSCFPNGCAKGYSPLLPLNPNAPGDNACIGFCTPDPQGTHTGHTTNPGGDPAGTTCGSGFQCRFADAFYDAPGADITVAGVVKKPGICVDSNWGDCTKCDITNTQTYRTTCLGTATAPIRAFGCVDLATFMAIPMGITSTGFAPTHAELLQEVSRQAGQMGINLRDLPGWSGAP